MFLVNRFTKVGVARSSRKISIISFPEWVIRIYCGIFRIGGYWATVKYVALPSYYQIILSAEGNHVMMAKKIIFMFMKSCSLVNDFLWRKHSFVSKASKALATKKFDHNSNKTSQTISKNAVRYTLVSGSYATRTHALYLSIYTCKMWLHRGYEHMSECHAVLLTWSAI